MRKEPETKEDGRYIIFYEFENESTSEKNAASKSGERESGERGSEQR